MPLPLNTDLTASLNNNILNPPNLTGGNPAVFPPPTQTDSTSDIGDVVVTAQKRDTTAPTTTTSPPQVAGGSTSPPTASVSANQPSNAQVAQQTMNILQALGGLQNPLNSYYQVQPVFKLFMTQDIDPFTASGQAQNSPTSNGSISTPQVYNTLQHMKSVVLAQTGVTGYNIRSVEIDCQVGGPSHFSAMTNATEVVITISEAMGVGFQEALLAAAQTLGVKNHLKAFIYLQLQFIAYDTAGNIVYDPVGPGLQIPNMWIWQISIVDIDVHIDAGGGTYILKCIPLAETSFDPITFDVPEAKTVSGGTMQAITDNLASVLNTSWQDRYANTTTQYAFKWHKLSETLKGNFASADDPSQYKTAFTNPDLSSVQGLQYNGTNSTFTFQSGIDISKFLNAVILNTKEMQALAKDDPSAGQTSTAPGFRKVIAWMLEPDVQLLGKFETYTQQYYKLITFHIRPYYTQRPIIDPQQPQDAAQPGVSLQALQDKIKQGLVKKRYDYIYTGLNIDVIDFDIHYNFQWNAILSRYAGKLSNAQQIAPQARVASATQANPSGPAGPQAITQTPSNQVSTAALEQNYIDASNAQSKAQQTLIGLQSQNGSSSDISTAQNNLTQANSAKQQAYTAFSQRQQQSAIATQVQQSSSTIIYAESLISAPATTTGSSPSPTMQNGLQVSTAHANKSVDDMMGTGAIQDPDIDKSVFAAVMGQLCAPSAYQFMSIDITIRGDPYWLGQTNLVRTAYMRNDVQPSANTPDFLVGDNCFVMHFRAPIGIGSNFAPDFRDSLVYNGLYAVNRVKSIFGGNDGFKQELSGLRLVLIDLAAAATGQGTTGSSAPVTDHNNSPAPGSNSATATPAPSGSGQGTDWYNSPQAAPYQSTINSAAAQYNVPPQLLAWQLGQESSFNPDAVGAGSTSSGVPMGIAQFTTGTAQNVPGYGPLDPTDPNASINAAAAYDQYLYGQTGSWQGALTKYGTLSGNPSQSTWNGFNNALQQSNLPPGS